MSRSLRADLLLSLALLASGRLSGQSRGKAGVPRNWFEAPQTMCRSLDGLGFVAGAWAPAAEDTPVYRCTYVATPGYEGPSPWHRRILRASAPLKMQVTC
jgi:hypothetical protein